MNFLKDKKKYSKTTKAMEFHPQDPPPLHYDNWLQTNHLIQMDFRIPQNTYTDPSPNITAFNYQPEDALRLSKF